MRRLVASYDLVPGQNERLRNIVCELRGAANSSARGAEMVLVCFSFVSVFWIHISVMQMRGNMRQLIIAVQTLREERDQVFVLRSMFIGVENARHSWTFRILESML